MSLRHAALVVALICPAALAAPLAAASAPRAEAAGAEVTLELGQINPLSLTSAEQPLTLQGTVANTSGSPLTDLSVEVTDNGPVRSREALAATRTAVPAATGQLLQTAKPLRPLGAGRKAAFTLTVADAGQHLGVNDGVYSLSVLVTGTVGVDRHRAAALLGGLNVAMPYFPDPIQAPLRTALVVPITEPPDQGPDDNHPSPALLADLAPSGRLGSLVTAVAGVGSRSATHVNVAVDPALLTRVCALAGKCGRDVPVGTPSEASDTAQQWLTALFAAVARPGVTVSGLPYADADLAALVSADDAAEATSLLARADHDVQAILTGAATSSLHPLLPVDGLADPALVDAATEAGASVSVVGSDLAPAPEATTIPATSTAMTQLRGTEQQALPALVTDATLQALLTAPSLVTPAEQEQSLFAELAMITSEQQNDPQQRTAVLLTPRNWAVAPAFASAVVRDLGSVPYARSEDLAVIEGAPPLERQIQSPPSADPPLAAETVRQVIGDRAQVQALKLLAAAPDTERLSGPLSESLDRALSSAWRSAGAGQGAQLVATVEASLKHDLGEVNIAGNHAGGVLLTGASGTLPVQVSNGLPEKVSVIVRLSADPTGQVTGRDVAVDLPADTRGGPPAARQLALPVTARSTRSTDVTVSVLTAAAPHLLVASTTVKVRSTAAGAVAVGITAGALTVLLLALVIRGSRRWTARRRRLQAEADAPVTVSGELLDDATAG